MIVFNNYVRLYWIVKRCWIFGIDAIYNIIIFIIIIIYQSSSVKAHLTGCIDWLAIDSCSFYNHK
jgi:hypothetical protein